MACFGYTYILSSSSTPYCVVERLVVVTKCNGASSTSQSIQCGATRCVGDYVRYLLSLFSTLPYHSFSSSPPLPQIYHHSDFSITNQSIPYSSSSTSPDTSLSPRSYNPYRKPYRGKSIAKWKLAVIIIFSILVRPIPSFYPFPYTPHSLLPFPLVFTSQSPPPVHPLTSIPNTQGAAIIAIAIYFIIIKKKERKREMELEELKARVARGEQIDVDAQLRKDGII